MARDALLVSVGADRRAAEPWVASFARRLPHLTVAALGDAVAPAAVRYVAAWKHPHGALADLPGLGAIFSLGAGVAHLMADAALPAAVAGCSGRPTSCAASTTGRSRPRRSTSSNRSRSTAPRRCGATRT